MKAFLAVYLKELKDNIRDKRSIFFALLYGPLLMPLMLVGSIAGGISKHSINFDQDLYVYSAQDLGPLEGYLAERNIKLKQAEAGWREQLKSGDMNLVVSVDDNYQKNMASGRTAFVTLYFNSEDDTSNKARQRLLGVLQNYDRSMASKRLQARGMDGQLIRPLQMIDADVADHGGPEKMIARMLPFIMVLALTLGGFYLAVDTAAGERERHSLEPLLSLNMRRSTLVLAKWAALSTFVALAGVVVVISCFSLLKFAPIPELQRIISVSALDFFFAYLLMLPLICFFSSGMLLIASFARTSKEAQTHLGIAMMVPMTPFFIIQFLNIKESLWLLATPVMSQFLLIEKVVVGEPLQLQEVLLSATGSLLLAAGLFVVTNVLFHSERIFSSEA
ncbi:ABC transporter permease [Agaribacterium sp. ZY112]|uniref:ABC transporter permease n=1 Tax=Agaribacterium sp. ZY112 TaxID=3233574 RepID=UPI0035235B60